MAGFAISAQHRERLDSVIITLLNVSGTCASSPFRVKFRSANHHSGSVKMLHIGM